MSQQDQYVESDPISALPTPFLLNSSLTPFLLPDKPPQELLQGSSRKEGLEDKGGDPADHHAHHPFEDEKVTLHGDNFGL